MRVIAFGREEMVSSLMPVYLTCHEFIYCLLSAMGHHWICNGASLEGSQHEVPCR